MTTSFEILQASPPASVPCDAAMADYCQFLFERLGLGSQASKPTCRTLGLTSCSRGEGVSTVAAQLAVTAARSLCKPVALVDCNLSDPAAHRLFNLPIGPGLRDALWEPAPVQQFLQPGGVPDLFVLSAGRAEHGAALAFSSPNLVHLLEDLRDSFALIVVDLPTFSHGVPSGVGALLDGLLLVIQAEKVRFEAAQRTMAAMRSTGINLLGAVMNKRQHYVPKWLYGTL
jgi:Mrp family chromosome partitioning ATPase